MAKNYKETTTQAAVLRTSTKTLSFCACPQYCCLCCRFFIIFCHFIVTPHLHKIQHRGESFFETCLRLSIFTCAKIQHT